MYCTLSPAFIAGLVPAKPGPRVSQVWNNFYLRPKGVEGKLPIKVRVKKIGGEVTPDKIYRLMVYSRKAGRDSDGNGYAIDHWELALYPQSRQQLKEMGIKKIYILDFAHCGKEEDMDLRPAPFRIWRMVGEQKKGIIYGYDPEEKPEISVSSVSSTVVDRFPVKVIAVGVEPVKGPANSTYFPKYEVEGAECLYDRRNNRNSVGLLEVVKTTKGDRSWLYCNLKELRDPLPEDAAVLTASEGKLALVKDGSVVSF